MLWNSTRQAGYSTLGRDLVESAARLCLRRPLQARGHRYPRLASITIVTIRLGSQFAIVPPLRVLYPEEASRRGLSQFVRCPPGGFPQDPLCARSRRFVDAPPTRAGDRAFRGLPWLRRKILGSRARRDNAACAGESLFCLSTTREQRCFFAEASRVYVECSRVHTRPYCGRFSGTGFSIKLAKPLSAICRTRELHRTNLLSLKIKNLPAGRHLARLVSDRNASRAASDVNHVAGGGKLFERAIRSSQCLLGRREPTLRASLEKITRRLLRQTIGRGSRCK